MRNEPNEITPEFDNDGSGRRISLYFNGGRASGEFEHC